ncbi:MAG: WYL domain-containing protein [Candidatus Gastranaerophilales bacterium]|nr:WYL domain-containing protein [Candidatus Gastranaerophilales bacterium]
MDMQKGIRETNLRNLDNKSITALRIISILNLLLECPCDDEMINSRLCEQINEIKALSEDTLCIYLNTLRVLGCEITRPAKRNDYKYILKSHPFNISLSKDEIETLIEIRKYISFLGDWKTALYVDKLFKTLSDSFSEETKTFFFESKRQSLVREIDSNNFFHEINQLENYCKQNKKLTLVYDSPESGVKNITIIADKINMENGTFYLRGYNEELETTMYLRLDRILDIKSVSMQTMDIQPKYTVVRYKIKGISPLSLNISDDESIIEKNDDEITIEALVSNKFKFFQKILSYANNCTIIDPPQIRDEFIKKLEHMLTLYNAEVL